MIETIYRMKSFKKHPFKDEIIEKIRKSIKYFPELNWILYVGITSNSLAEAQADVDNMMVKFKINYNPSFRTIFHEIMHLVQYNCKDFPKTEQSCDIFSLARIPEELMLLEKDNSCYVISRGNYSDVEIAKKALEYRNSGKKDYIRYFNKLMGENN